MASDDFPVNQPRNLMVSKWCGRISSIHSRRQKKSTAFILTLKGSLNSPPSPQSGYRAGFEQLLERDGAKSGLTRHEETRAFTGPNLRVGSVSSRFPRISGGFDWKASDPWKEWDPGRYPPRTNGESHSTPGIEVAYRKDPQTAQAALKSRRAAAGGTPKSV